jgi:hypothetical protein
MKSDFLKELEKALGIDQAKSEEKTIINVIKEDPVLLHELTLLISINPLKKE